MRPRRTPPSMEYRTVIRAAGAGDGETGYRSVPDASPQQHASAQPLRVLIVDENADVAESLGTLVASWGCTVRSAYTAGKALAIAAEFAPTVVLLDLGLPDLHGYHLAKQLRKEAAGRPLYCIAVSGWYQIADQLQSAAAGISHHLVKPVNLEVLREILSKYQSLQAQ